MQSEIKSPSLISRGSHESQSNGPRAPFASSMDRIKRISPKRKHSYLETAPNTPENCVYSIRKPSIVQTPALKRIKRDAKEQNCSAPAPPKPRKTVKQLKYERMKCRTNENREKIGVKNLQGIANQSTANSSIVNQSPVEYSQVEDMVEETEEPNPKSMRQLYSTADSWSTDSSD